MKHTPGPWHALKYPDVKSWTVAQIESVASKIKTKEDATLIASAPDMYEALLGIVKKVEAGVHPMSAIEHAKKALAKARGES